MVDIPTHHMVYGTTRDYLTGETVVDTDDERERQKLARILVEDRGFAREEIRARRRIETLFAGQYVVSTVDFSVSLHQKPVMIIRYAPGSLVTRERPALAAARVLEQDGQIPWAVVTNGRDAELLDVFSGQVIATGLAAIPDRGQAMAALATLRFDPLTDAGRRDKELRILNAYDKEICCVGGPCALPNAPEG